MGGTIYGDAAGYSVALSSNGGDVVAFGAIGRDANGGDSGYVKVYERDASTLLGWSHIGSNIVGEAAGDECGFSIALSANGQALAIGSRHNDGNGILSGQVRIYQRDTSSLEWSQVGQDLYGNAAYDVAGFTIDLSSDGSSFTFSFISY